jgi:hypothetical protein
MEQSDESRSRGSDEHQDEHKNLYWFGPSEHNTLCPVWVAILFIDLGEMDRRARKGEGLQSWEYCEKKLFFVSQEFSCG